MLLAVSFRRSFCGLNVPFFKQYMVCATTCVWQYPDSRRAACTGQQLVLKRRDVPALSVAGVRQGGARGGQGAGGARARGAP